MRTIFSFILKTVVFFGVACYAFNTTPKIALAHQNLIISGGSSFSSVVISGTASFADGSATAPSIANIGDLDTGGYWPTDGTFAITADGVVSIWFRGDYNVSYDGFIPVTNGSLDLGILGNAWRNLYVSSTIFGVNQQMSGTVTTTNLVVTTGGLTVTNGLTSLQQTELGPVYNRSGNALDISAIGGQTLTLNGEGGTWLGGNYNGSNVGVIFYDDQYPQTDDTYDSGTTTARWKSVNTVKLSATSTMATHSTTTNSMYAAGLSALGATGDFVCQNNTTGELQVQLTNCTISSARFKEHVKTLNTEELAKRVGALRSVMFDYRNGDVGSLGTVQDEGFIAEEVAIIDPYLVGWVEGTDEQIKEVESLYPDLKLINRDGKIFIPQTVDYMKISVLLVGSDQHQNEQIAELQSQMEDLKKEDLSIWGMIKHILNSI